MRWMRSIFMGWRFGRSFGRRLSKLLKVICMAGLLLTASGCISGRLGGSESPDVVINELRDNNNALKEEVARLQKSIDLRLAEIDTLQQQVQGAMPMAGVPAARVVKLHLGRYSSAVDTNGDKRDDMIRLYVQPLDQQGRFLPATGEATIQAILLREDDGPLPLAKLTLSSDVWDKSYRTGLTGTHFSIELALAGTDSAALNTLKKGMHQITVMVSFTDAGTGTSISQQAVYAVRR